MNPEFVRNARERLRQKYLIIGVACVIGIAILFGAYGAEKNSYKYTYAPGPLDWTAVGLSAFVVLLVISFAIMYFVNSYLCSIAVSREKQQRTYELQLMTRLSPYELAVGKLFGAPILGYVLIGVFLIFALLAALAFGGVSAKLFFVSYLLLFTSGIALNACALLLSTYLEKTWAFSFIFIGLVVMMPMLGLFAMGSYGYERGTSVLNPMATIAGVYGEVATHTNVFGISVPAVLTQVCFYLLIAAVAFYATTLRIKQIRQPMMKYHIMWISGLLLVVTLALLWPPIFNTLGGQGGVYGTLELQYARVNYFDTLAISLSIAFGLILLVTIGFLGNWHELSIWLRKRHSGLIEHVSWWLDEKALPTFIAFSLGLTAVSLFLICYMLFGFSRQLQSNSGMFIGLSVIFLLFVVRDICFISGMRLTRHGRNLYLPLLFLALFYLIGSILAAIFIPDSGALTATFFPWTYLFGYQELAAHAWQIGIIVGVEALLMLVFHVFALRYAQKRAFATAKP